MRSDGYHKLGSVDPEEVRALYWHHGLNCREIGTKLGCSGKSVQAFMIRNAIPRRPGGTQVTHGLTGTGTYRSWSGAKARCFNPNHRQYKDYGRRGLLMCERWRESFDAFLEDMGERPKGRSLDRRDNSGHYSCGRCDECVRHGWPSNCRWATPSEQAYNRRPKSRVNLYFRKHGCLECGGGPPCTPDACGLGVALHDAGPARVDEGDAGLRGLADRAVEQVVVRK